MFAASIILSFLIAVNSLPAPANDAIDLISRCAAETQKRRENDSVITISQRLRVSAEESSLNPSIAGYPALGQESQPEQVQERIWFSVLDRGQKPVLGLAAEDFKLRVNGWPAAMENFHAGQPTEDKSIPLLAWLLIDFNPNINANVIARQAAAAAGLFAMIHPSSAAGVKLISNYSETLAPLAHDPEALSRSFRDFGKKRNELRISAGSDAIILGPAGLLGAIERSIDELEDYAAAQKDLEFRKAVIILSDANINPSYSRRPLFEKAARTGTFLYPIFIPRRSMGFWVESYFALGKDTAGLAMTFGAMNPGSEVLKLPRENQDPNALAFNFLNIIRDLNGKYSFSAPHLPENGKARLDLQSLKKNIAIRLPRRQLP